jgi:hypothetical protein
MPLSEDPLTTNRFELIPGLESLSMVPLDNGKSLPYEASFYITIAPVSSNRTTVIVRTTSCSLLDGQEPGIHGGWANHYRTVEPIQQEEDNVLAAISKELSKPK